MPIYGVIAGVITAFAPDGSVSWDDLHGEIELLSGSPVDGLCVGGFMSETEGSAPEEMFALCQAVGRRGRKPFVAMISPDSQPEANDLIQAVDSGGARAVIVAQPHYLCQPGMHGLMQMFARLRQETLLPLLLANCQRTAMIPAEVMLELVSEKVIDGILIGGDGAHLMVDMLCLHLDVPVFSGIEDLHYVSLLLGAQGIMSDLAAIFPNEVTGMYRAHRERKDTEAKALHERLVRLWRMLEHPSEQRARIRSVLTSLGRNVGGPRSPYDLGNAEMFGKVQRTLELEGLAIASTTVL